MLKSVSFSTTFYSIPPPIETPSWMARNGSDVEDKQDYYCKAFGWLDRVRNSVTLPEKGCGVLL